MIQTREPLSPAQLEAKLIQCVSDLTRAELELRKARDAETDAELKFRDAHRRAVLASDCLKVARGGYTTAERDAWVERQCVVEWETYRLASTKREAAQDHVRTVRDITSAVQTIAALTRAAFSLAGRDG